MVEKGKTAFLVDAESRLNSNLATQYFGAGAFVATACSQPTSSIPPLSSVYMDGKSSVSPAEFRDSTHRGKRQCAS